jgi:hypothetical protein
LAVAAITVLGIMLAACGSTSSAHPSAQPPPASATRSEHTSVRPFASSSATAVQTAVQLRRHRQSPIDAVVNVAKRIYHRETKGAKLLRETARIARDGVLLNALSRGDLSRAQAEADAQLASPSNHLAHVTRISVIRGSRVLVNAIENSDGVFVAAPARRVLGLHGRLLGTLLVSIQDVTGFVKLVHRVTGAEVVVRGASGHVRTSLGTAALVRLPTSGQVRLAGRTHVVRSFHEIGWGNEPLTIWLLMGA